MDYRKDTEKIKMKIFTSKSFKQKLIISIICITLLELCCPLLMSKTKAANDDDIFGGKIMSLVRDFLTGLADAAAGVVQFGVTGEWENVVDNPGSGDPEVTDKYFIKTDKFKYPKLKVSPELIFANQIELLDVNFISADTGRNYAIKLQNNGPLKALRNIVAGWYVTLRTMATVGLLSVLIYIGIRIIISSTSSEKAKYKQRLVDWIVAFCLLFFMHYIMAAVVTVVNKVNNVLGEAAGVDSGLELISDYGGVTYIEGGGNSAVNELIPPASVRRENAVNALSGIVRGNPEGTAVWEEISRSQNSQGERIKYGATLVYNGVTYHIYEEFSSGGSNSYSYTYKKEGDLFETNLSVSNTSNSNNNNQANSENSGTDPQSAVDPNLGVNVGSSVSTNSYVDSMHVRFFTNYVRLYLNVVNDNEYLPQSTAYLILYIALITLTGVFAVRYIKRLIYIAFLTLMAPMVALTYPLDKIKDRKSTSMEYVV